MLKDILIALAIGVALWAVYWLGAFLEGLLLESGSLLDIYLYVYWPEGVPYIIGAILLTISLWSAGRLIAYLRREGLLKRKLLTAYLSAAILYSLFQLGLGFLLS